MLWYHNPYVALLVAATVLLFVLAVFGWRHRSAPGRTPGIFLLLAVAEWSLAYAFELGSATLEAKTIWSQIKYLGVVTVPVSWMAFALQYTGRVKQLKLRHVALLLILPVVTLLLVWTNHLHGLIWSDIRMDTTGSLPMRIAVHAKWFWIHTTYSYLLLFLGAAVLVRALLRSPHLYRGKADAVLLAVLAPWIGNILHIYRLGPFPHLDLTPFAFTLTGAAIAWSLFRFHLLDILPSARDAVIESMKDIVIVMDPQNRILDVNPAGMRIFSRSVSKPIGQPAAEVLSNHPRLVEGFNDLAETPLEISLEESGVRSWFDLHITPLHDQYGDLIGRLAVLHDITARKEAEKVWQNAHDELERQIEERTAALTITNEQLSHEIGQRERVEQSLRESEQKYRLLVEGAKEAIIIIQDGRIKYANPVSLEYSGFSMEEMMTQTLTAFIHPDDRARVVELYLAKMRGEDVSPGSSYRIVDKSGFTRWVESRSSLLSWEGRPGLLTFLTDITERKQTEEALREAYDIINRSPAVAFLWRNEEGWPVEFVSDNVEVLFGYTAQEFVSGKVVYASTVHPDDLERVAGEVLRFSEEEARERFAHEPYRIVTQDGKVKWLDDRTYIRRDEKGKITHYQGIVEDITERKKTEEALRKSEARFRLITENMVDTVSQLDSQGNVLYTSPSVERVFGHKSSELLGRSGFELVHPDDLDPLLKKTQGAYHAHAPSVRLEYRYRHANGDYQWVESATRLLYDDHGQFAGSILGSRDITQRKRAEEERQRLEEQVRHVQKLESLGVLAGGIAHDFNNILMAILGNADLALLALSGASPARQNIQEIEKATHRAAELCRQMLAYSGRGRFLIETLNLSEVVQEMTHMLQVSISKKAILSYHFAHTLPLVDADATQLRQIIINLITNASEAIGDKDGVISISTGAMECDQAYLRETYLDDNLSEGLYVYLEVSDTGCGMDEETIQKVFDPFFTTKFTGRGLGLAAVLGIVRGHKGAIKVYSKPGKGSTFRILFPAVGGEAEDQAKREKEKKQVWLGRGTVLLIDDEEAIREVGKQMLERLGFQVLTAADGREALQVFGEHANEVGCVILDLTMPHMDGEECFRELRRIRSDIRVIMSSGYNEQEVSHRFAGKGVAGFIQKPYALKNLREELRRVLG